MESKVVYGVYTQFEPTWKYDETLESIWSTRELAEAALTRISDHMDHKWVNEIHVDSDCLHLSSEQTKGDLGGL